MENEEEIKKLKIEIELIKEELKMLRADIFVAILLSVLFSLPLFLIVRW